MAGSSRVRIDPDARKHLDELVDQLDGMGHGDLTAPDVVSALILYVANAPIALGITREFIRYRARRDGVRRERRGKSRG